VAVLACGVHAASTSAVEYATSAAGPCAPAPTVTGVTEGHSLPGTVAPSLGTLRAVLLLVHAADVPPDASVTPPPALFEDAADWFRSMSYGRLEFQVETPPRWLRLPATSALYLDDPTRFLADSVAAADPYVDFSQVDVVYLAPASGTPETRTSAILNGFGVRADGREIRLWVPWQAGFTHETNTDPWIVVHETGHLLGLPDLYSSGAVSTFHTWDVMAARYPAELLAWHRWKLGWIDRSQVACVTGRARRTVTLSPIERAGGTKALFLKRGAKVLAVEVRARVGYDRTLCDTGVLVYEVDQTPLKRAPVRIHAAQRDRPRRGCASKWNAPFDVARGEVRTYRLPSFGARLELLARLRDGSYRVRVRPV
jgi:M6 family metalloprotease-like protein